MEHIRVIYGRSNWKPISLLIQLRTLSKWSHVGLVIGNSVVEAVGGMGVVITPIEDFYARYSETLEKTMPCVSKEYAHFYALGKVGTAYDLKAVLGYLFMLGWDDIHADHCSELVAGSTQLFDPALLHTIVPGQLVKLKAKE